MGRLVSESFGTAVSMVTEVMVGIVVVFFFFFNESAA